MVSFYEYEEDDFPDVIIYPRPPVEEEDDELDSTPTWTVRRVVMLLIALIMIISMLAAYDLLPFVNMITQEGQSAPRPPIIPDGLREIIQRSLLI